MEFTFFDLKSRPVVNLTRKALLLTFFAMAVQSVVGQSTPENVKKFYPLANDQFNRGRYKAAATNFEELVRSDPKNANLNYKAGLCYLTLPGQKDKALPFLEVAVGDLTEKYKDSPNERKAPYDALKQLARAYHIVFQFDKAIETYKKYVATAKITDPATLNELNRQVEMCQSGKLIAETPVAATIVNLGPKINTRYDEYTPVIDATESVLIFTSRRPTGTGGFLDENGEPFEDIYISAKKDTVWDAPKSIGSNINTDGHEAAISLSADGQELFIYRDEYGDGNIMASQLVNGVWQVPVRLGLNVNTPYRETHAAVSADGQTLYFTSDRPGGQGGMDIWRARRLPTGDWGKAENLGPRVNTKYDDEAPFLHPDGKTLFFSSKGHTSMGGFDIMFSILGDDGQWSSAMNMGVPVNSADDDLFFMLSTDGKRAYFASSSKGGFGGKDLYMMYLEREETPLTVYKGIIAADASGNIPSNVTISVSDNNSGELYGTYRPRTDNGKFILVLSPGKDYLISYEADGYSVRSEKLFVPENSAYFEINRAIQMQPVNLQGRN